MYQILFFFQTESHYVALTVLELYVDQAGIKFRDPSASVSQLSELKAFAIILGSKLSTF